MCLDLGMFSQCPLCSKKKKKFWWAELRVLDLAVDNAQMWAPVVFCQSPDRWQLFSFTSSSSDSNQSDEDSMSEGELATLKEEVEEKKKLIATLRNKPWRMKKRLLLLK